MTAGYLIVILNASAVGFMGCWVLALRAEVRNSWARGTAALQGWREGQHTIDRLLERNAELVREIGERDTPTLRTRSAPPAGQPDR